MFVRLRCRFAMLVALAVLTGETIAHAADAPAPAAEKTLSLSPREKIDRALDKKISVEFVETPLSDVVDFLRNQLQIEIHLDNKSLEDAGVAHDTPVTRNLHNISARSILRYLLGSLDLTFLTTDGVLLITTPEAEAHQLRTEVYPVDDLLKATNDFGEPIEDYDALIEIITSPIAPTTWDEVGGPGSIDGLQGNLVVRQTGEVHRYISQLLAAIHQVRKLPAEAPLPAPIQIGGRNTDVEKSVRASLNRNLSVDFAETPLSDVCEYLRNQLKIEVQLDSKALEDAGAGSDSPINFQAKDLQVAALLNLMLKPLDLTYAVKDEVLLITTPEKSSSELNCMLFPVLDLVEHSALPAESLEQLCSVITSTVQPSVWDEVGGPCSIVPVVAAHSLLISATDSELAQVTELLAKLRKNHAAKGVAGSTPAASQLQTCVYQLWMPSHKLDATYHSEPSKLAGGSKSSNAASGSSTPAGPSRATLSVNVPAVQKVTPTEVAQYLQQTVEPESWKKGNANIVILGDRLIIRQTPLLHRRISRLLSSMGLSYTATHGGSSHGVAGMESGTSGGGFFRVD